MHQRLVIRKKNPSTNTWETEANGIVITDFFGAKVSNNIGKKRDDFGFSIRNYNDSLHQQFFSGDTSTTEFTLNYYPIPSWALSGEQQACFVYVNDVLQTYTTNYTISGSTLEFTSAPALGIKNIKLVFPVIDADDLVDMYFWKNSDWASLTTEQKNNARKVEGIISEPGINKGNNIIGVRGFGLIDSIFSGMAFALFDNTTIKYAHLAIQQIISQLNKYNPNRTIYGQDPTEWGNIGNDETTQSITYTGKYRTAIEMIEELSSDAYTGNGQYMYWVQYNATEDRYEFHWKEKNTTSTATVTEGTSDINIIGAKRAVDDVINVVIYNCMPFGNVLTESGLKDISEINIGDKVLTHKGRFRKVINKFERDYRGKSIFIKEMLNNDLLEVTPEHPIYTWDGKDYIWKKAEELCEGDYLVYPKSQYWKPKKVRFLNKKVNLEIAEFVGLFLGDGTSNDLMFSISHNIKDRELINRTKHLIKSIFNLEPKEHKVKDKNCVIVYACSKQYATELKKLINPKKY